MSPRPGRIERQDPDCDDSHGNVGHVTRLHTNEDEEEYAI
jgi:hypothetical protein